MRSGRHWTERPRWLIPCGAALLAVATLGACEGDAPARDIRRERSEPEPAARAAASKSVRPAALAGSWYPSGTDELGELVDGFMSSADSPPATGDGPIRALISPHAGYAFSGPTAGFGYSLVRDRSVHRVIVLAPAHHVALTGMSIAERTHYSTPLGEIPLDLEAIERLRRSRLVRSVAGAHGREHSIEMQLPLLQRALAPGWKLVPILVGRLSADDAAEAGRMLEPLADERTLVVASSDFTHYGPSYGYEPFERDGRIAERLRELDMGAFERIEDKDPGGFLAYRERTGITACGFFPVLVLLHMLPAAATATLLHYDTSGHVTGDFENSVSYLSVAFTSRPPLGLSAATRSQRLPREQMELLHLLARRAVQRVVRDGDDEPDPERLLGGLIVPPELREESGAFVTLKQGEDLRGCIGSVEAQEPLYLAVIHNAVNAAVHDPRFPPVQRDEVRGLTVEVSVLSPLREIPSYERFLVGEQGIVLARDGRRAVFLPEVAIEQGWDRAETLTHLARKAGLAPDAWQGSGARFWIFTTQALTAPWAP